MQTHELYYLVMVLAAFGIFGVVLAANYLKYRSWVKLPQRRP
jgi:hypothetical protein